MNTCPICGKDDQVQKVSAIVSGGSNVSSYSGVAPSINYTDGKVGYGTSVISGSMLSSTNLAWKLARPTKPNEPGVSGKVILGVVLAMSFACFIPIAMENQWWPIFIGLFLFVVGFILIVKGNEEKQKAADEYKKKLKVWEKETEEWKKLYYCHRDDVMFNPETGTYWTWN
jgi:hypothetical protein